MVRKLLYVVTVCLLFGHSSQAEEAVGKPDSASLSQLVEGSAIGRFVLTPFDNHLILLDSATGQTWRLDAKDNGSQVVWKPIAGVETWSKAIAEVARNATDGSLDIRALPEHGAVILRGKRADVEAASEAINKLERQH